MAIRERSSGNQVTGKPLPCSKCGCTDIRVIGKQRYCRHCGKPWFHRLAPDEVKPQGVTYHVLRCPSCGSDKTKVTRTTRPIRYHKCKMCEHNFKSVEE